MFWLLGLLLCLLLVGTHEIGYRMGHRSARTSDEQGRSQWQSWEAEVLGLLGLLVAFSFGMAVARFDARRQLIVDEANAVGTTYLRSRFVPAPAGEELRQLLRNYVDARLAYHDAGVNLAAVRAAARRSAEVQAQIWAAVVKAASDDSRATTLALLVDSTNEMFDLEAKRRAALFNHVPWTVLLMIVLVASAAMTLIGYSRGLAGRRLPFGSVAMPLLISAVIVLVFDLDYPRLGLVRLGQQSMLQLKAGL